MKIPYIQNPQAMTEPRPSLVPDEQVTWISEFIVPWNFTDRADIGIVGIPFDSAVSFRPGTRFGPSSVRDALKFNTTYNAELDLDISNLRIVDCGDIDTTLDLDEAHKRVESALTAIVGCGISPLVIGGDHSLTYPCVKALCHNMPGRKLGIIDFDTHFDCRPSIKGKEHSGLWVRKVQEIEGSPVRGENIVQIGIHGFAYSTFYRNDTRKRGINVFTPLDVKKRGMQSVMQDGLRLASDGTDAIYISVDIDCIDQAFAPGTSVPTPGGLFPSDVISGVVEAGKHPLTRAFDIVEISPVLDSGNMTSRLGAEIIMNYLCGLSSRSMNE